MHLFILAMVAACGANLFDNGDPTTEDTTEPTPFGGGGNGGGNGGGGDDDDGTTPIDTGTPITDTGVQLDDTCVIGVAALCVCAELVGYPCDKADQLGLYKECVAGTENGQIVECYESHVFDYSVDCDAAAKDCFN